MNRTLTLLAGSLLVAACADDPAGPQLAPLVVEDLAAEVDPMIGTGGSGNVIPGALLPYGMVRASPAGVGEHGRIAAYRYGDTALRGFTHTHLQGPGGSANGYNELLVTPFTATPDDAFVATHTSGFDHATERAEPGYYAVTLADAGVDVELTATAHAAVHRYTYPTGARGRLLVDLGVAMGAAKDAHLEQVDAHTLRGWARYDEHPALSFILQGEPTGEAILYFALTVDRDADEVGFFRRGYVNEEADGEIDGADIGAWLGFDPGDAPVTVRVGLSFIDMAQARTHLDAEVGERSFDEVRAAARATWNEALSRVKVRGGTASERRVFYTALYHSLFQPADYTEVGGRFHSATDGEHHVHDAGARRFYTDDWCMWDTYRTTHPLGTLVAPERRSDMVWSMLHAYEEGGWLPKCTWHATGYSRVMTGNPAVAIIADAYVKGLRDFDDALAWEAVDKAGQQDIANIAEDQLCGYLNLGTVPDYLTLGYVPAACDPDQAASMTLEYAYDDWATARFAEARGDLEAAGRYDARAQNWRNQWNPETGFMQARAADGSWVEPFDPDGYAKYFVESTARIFSFFVPHDVPGMIDVMGGAEATTARLDAFFDGGYLDISNEPSFHVPWLYGRTGEPDKTRARVREILATDFSDAPDGLPGNDDSGATSAWYVLAALGVYPIAPGDGVWDLTVPRFETAELWIADLDDPTVGHTVVIEAPRPPSGEETLRGITLDGVVLDAPRVDHAALLGAKTLRFELGAE
ncbi:MAG: glycoside hydrolase family 92 protein [Deltaproteobacteria bacterium]|nr:MAG: glycoside hydrolase family 92 protein [Deltaproteobacteria bacterium]